MKIRDDAWWLVGAAVLITVIVVVFAAIFGLSKDLLIFVGFLSGVVYALTNANDKRIINGREAVGESKMFEETDFLAIAGLFGVIITWLLLPIVFALFALSMDPQTTLWNAVAIAFSTQFSAGGIQFPLPGFIYAGLFTILSTYTYLKLLELRSLSFFAIMLPMVFALDILSAIILFDDKVFSFEYIILPTLLVCFFALNYFQPRHTTAQTGESEYTDRTAVYFWVFLFVLFSVLTDIVVRASLKSIAFPQQFFVSLGFRAAYFSMFILFFVVWWLKLRKIDVLAELRQWRKLGVLLATPITFALSFALSTPVKANNLAIGPVVNFVGNMLVLSFVGAFYKTDGNSPRLRDRLAEVYLQTNAGGIRKYLYAILYSGFVAVVIVWGVLRLSVSAQSP